MSVLLQFDGGARPNPGKCAGAYVLYDYDTSIEITRGSIFIENGTNNIGEYNGLLLGLQKCIELKYKKIYTEGDSLLVINQVTSKWKTNDKNLKKYCDKIKDLIQSFDSFEIRHIKRNENSIADSISTETILQKI